MRRTITNKVLKQIKSSDIRRGLQDLQIYPVIGTCSMSYLKGNDLFNQTLGRKFSFAEKAHILKLASTYLRAISKSSDWLYARNTFFNFVTLVNTNSINLSINLGKKFTYYGDNRVGVCFISPYKININEMTYHSQVIDALGDELIAYCNKITK